MAPGLMTILFPLAIAFLPMIFGMDNKEIAEMLGGYMAGVTVSGVLWAIFQNNAGGAWDNAKKSFEAGVEINGEMTYKGSEAHKASVTGDTVGDPFKDTSGPSMNILIKLTCLIGLVVAPILGSHSSASNVDDQVTEDLGIELSIEQEAMKYVEDCVCPQEELYEIIEIKTQDLLKKYPEKNSDGSPNEDFDKLSNLIMQYAQENCAQ